MTIDSNVEIWEFVSRYDINGLISYETTSINESNGQIDNNLFPNNKQLIKIVDLLGRDSEGLINQPLFYIYDDGTVDKKINAGVKINHSF